MKYLQKVFHENDNYPKYAIKQILKQYYDDEQELDMTNTNLNLNDVVEEKKQHLLLVPQQGKKGDFVIKSMKKRMKALLQTNIRSKMSFPANKLSTCFK